MLGVTFEIRGIENIQKKTGGVVVMNHQSAIDLGSKRFFYFIIVVAMIQHSASEQYKLWKM